MAVICLTAAAGSPGVTSTVLGMALCWPRPVLVVEADPTAGSAILAGRFRGLQGDIGRARFPAAHGTLEEHAVGHAQQAVATMRMGLAQGDVDQGDVHHLPAQAGALAALQQFHVVVQAVT